MKKLFRRMKPVHLLLIALLAACFAFALAACNNTDPGPGPGPGPDTGTDEQTGIVLSANELTLDLYDDAVLSAEGDYGELSYVSSAPAVVSVDNEGKLIALSAGKADITVTGGNKSAKCAVTVEDNGLVPAIDVKLQNNALGILKGENVTLNPVVNFNGKTYTDAVFTYEADDSGCISVENATVTGVKIGNATLTVKASWRNADALPTMTAEVDVSVNIDAEIELTNSEIVLYRADPNGDGLALTDTLEATVLVGGKEEPAIAVTWEEVENVNDVVAVDPNTGVITTNKIGAASFVAVATVDGVQIKSAPVEISVLPVTADMTDKKPVDMELYGDAPSFSLSDLPEADRYLQGLELISVSRKEGELTNTKFSFTKGSNNTIVISDVNAVAAKKGDQVWSLDFGDVIYEISVGIADKIIRTADDFVNLYGTELDTMYATENPGEGNAQESWNGYFILGNDIDGQGAYIERIIAERTPDNHTDDKEDSFSHGQDGQGFRGTFDGRGYTLSNFKVNRNGVWGFVGNGAIIKNVALVDITSDTNGVYLFADTVGGATLENIFISTEFNFYQGMDYVNGTHMKNVVVYIPNTSYFMGQKTPWIEPSFTDVYIFSKAEENEADDRDKNLGVNSFSADGYKGNTDFAAINFGDHFTSNCWVMSDSLDIPVFKSVAVAADIYKGGTIDLSSLLPAYMDGAEFVASDPNVLSLNGTMASGISAGTAAVIVNVNGVSFEIEITVSEIEIIEEEFEFSKHSEDAGKKNGAYTGFTLAEIDSDLTGGLKVEHGSIGGPEVAGTVENGIWKFADLSSLAVGENKFFLYGTNGKIYELRAIVADKIITTAEEFKNMYGTDIAPEDMYATQTGEKGKLVWNGYFILGNNIDGEGTEITRISDDIFTEENLWGEGEGAIGFIGTFDGRGHTLSNFTVKDSKLGIFGFVGWGAAIRNVAIVGLDCTGVQRSFFAHAFAGATMENVYIDVKGTFDTGIGMLNSGTIKNTIIHMPGVSYGFVAAVPQWTVNNQVENVYAFSNTPNGGQAGKVFDLKENAYKTDAEFMAIDFETVFGINETDSIWVMDETLAIPVFRSSIG